MDNNSGLGSSYNSFSTSKGTSNSDFLNSNSLVAKFIFLLIVIFGFIVLLKFGLTIISYFLNSFYCYSLLSFFIIGFKNKP